MNSEFRGALFLLFRALGQHEANDEAHREAHFHAHAQVVKQKGEAAAQRQPQPHPGQDKPFGVLGVHNSMGFCKISSNSATDCCTSP